MSGTALLVVTALGLLVPAFIVVLVLWLAGRRAEAADAHAAIAARRHEALVSLGAAVAGAVTAVIVLTHTLTWTALGPLPVTHGVLQAVAPFLVCVVFCLVRAAGEITWPRPSGAVRTAPLARRTVTDLGGRRLTWLLVTVVIGVAAIVTYGLTARGDGETVAHRVVRNATGDVVHGASGPYPGWPYGVPILVALAAAALVTLSALRVVARRSPLGGIPAAHDDAVRRTSAARLLGGAQLTIGGGISLLNLLAAVVLASAEWLIAAWLAAAVGLALGIASVIGGLTAVVPWRPRFVATGSGSIDAVKVDGA